MRKDESHDKAREIYLRENGEITPKEIAERLGIAAEKVRKWKYRDKWESELKKPRRGAPKGNQNAAGHGAPKGNTNAETHGAYSRPRMDRLTESEQQEIEALQADFINNALRQLKRLEIKRADLEKRIADLQNTPEDTKLLDRTMNIRSKSKNTNYQFYSAPFSRRMILESELNRVDGRIIKLLDSIKNHENEQKRFDLDRERLEFQKQKALGVFNLDDDGMIIPDDENIN